MTVVIVVFVFILILKAISFLELPGQQTFMYDKHCIFQPTPKHSAYFQEAAVVVVVEEVVAMVVVAVVVEAVAMGVVVVAEVEVEGKLDLQHLTLGGVGWN